MRAEFSRLSSSLVSSYDFFSSLKRSASPINFLCVPTPLLPSDLLAPSSSPLTSTLVLHPPESSTLGTLTVKELLHHEEECEKEEQETWNEKDHELSELKLLHEKTILQLNER